MEESFGPGNPIGQKADQNERFDQKRKQRQADMRRGRSVPDNDSREMESPRTPNHGGSPYRRDYTPRRGSRSNSPEGVKIVDVHPSHRGTTYTRKPKKKKKKMKRAETARTMERDAFFLAPTQEAPAFTYVETPPQSNDGGRANSAEDNAGDFDGIDSKEGMDDPEPVPVKPKKKKKPKSMISLDSYIKKKDQKKVQLPDYNRRVEDELEDEGMISAQGVFGGGGGGGGGYGGSLAGVKYSDGHIYEPE